MEIRKVSTEIGNGVFAIEDIPKKTILMQYPGTLHRCTSEQISQELTNKLHSNPNQKHYYVLEFKYFDYWWVLDPALYLREALAPMMNHSNLAPNCKLQITHNDGDTTPTVLVVTTATISVNEELRWNYDILEKETDWMINT